MDRYRGPRIKDSPSTTTKQLRLEKIDSVLKTIRLENAKTVSKGRRAVKEYLVEPKYYVGFENKANAIKVWLNK